MLVKASIGEQIMFGNSYLHIFYVVPLSDGRFVFIECSKTCNAPT